MRAYDLDVLARSAERGLGGETLLAWHNKFGGTNASQTCKGKEEFKAATAGVGVATTWEVLKTGLRTIAFLEAGFVYWYVTFKALTDGTETVLTKKT